MRYYVTTSKNTFWTVVPEVPGVGTEDVPSREEAIDRCRQRAATEIAAYRRLGSDLSVSQGEQIIDWTAPWWLVPDWLVPTPRSVVVAAVRRMDELGANLESFLDGLTVIDLDHNSGGGWSVRRTLDHVAGGFGIGLRRLEPWPLEADDAQAQAIAQLVDRLRSAPLDATEHVGMNSEPGRVRWTPAKVARVVSTLQSAWRAHLVEGGPEPAMPIGHEDMPSDDERVAANRLESLKEADAELRRLAAKDRRVRGIAISYRYYRDRLVRWPTDDRERLETMREAFQERLLKMDEHDLACVRLAPNGQCDSVRMELGLGLSHVQEHLEQMRMTVTAA